MAFELYIKERHEKIDHWEEGIFDLVDGVSKFPNLNKIWESYFDDLRISPNVANEITHELIEVMELAEKSKEHKHLVPLIIRLLTFFSAAYISGSEIRCAND